MIDSTILLPISNEGISVERLVFETMDCVADDLTPIVSLGYCYHGDPLDSIVVYLAVSFRFMGQGVSWANADIALRGAFRTDASGLPLPEDREGAAEWVGGNMIAAMYAKARTIIEQRADDSLIGLVTLPMIDAFEVWRNGYNDRINIWANEAPGQPIMPEDSEYFSRGPIQLIDEDPAGQSAKDSEGDWYEEYDEERDEYWEDESDEEWDDEYDEDRDDAEDEDSPAAKPLTRIDAANHATVGVWSMTDDGEFVMAEPYKTMLTECKHEAALGWRKSIYGYLAERSPYTYEQLDEELLRRVMEQGLSPLEIVDEYIIEALSGDLLPGA